MDSYNGIEHKCPCCGYEVEFDWKEDKYIKGDESFIKIENSVGRTSTFETDMQNEWGDYEQVMLLGCPKCRAVSYVFW